ncbi:MAG: AbrB/MazE/SpoVT family DNA-binding domain-containing protein [Acidobacteriia bacterium]|nr:AbrB/MazE/SpoVT family DNA-binding domain-containing protein [Terriglobia bacterium]
MTKATISAKGQVSIPKTIRERLNLKPGTQVVIDVQGEKVVMKRLVSGFPDWRTMRGMFRGVGDLHDDLEKDRAAELARDDARLKSF